MDQKLLFMLKLNITTLLLVVQTALSVDSQFEACKPYNCGKGPNISYPFWIQGKQDSFCGYPGFQLSCINNEPIFNMSGNGYVIREIYHQNQSFLVTQASLQDKVCPSHISNLTLDRFPFTFGPAHVSVFIFFNCTHPLPTEYEGYSLNCTTGNVIHRSLALLRYDPMWNEVSGICNASVIVPIDKTESQNLDTLPYRNMIIHALRKGFLLKWNASSCSECNRSGGHCGFDFENFRFTCFCTDRPHLKSCKRRKKHTGTKIAIGVGTGAGVILMACIFYLIRHRRKLLSKSSALISRDITPDSSSKPDLENGGSYFLTPIFSYDELEEATNNFDSSKELGDGGFGTVYHGKLKDGRVVAVKRLYENNYKRVEQFMNEIAILSRLRHRNLVSLYGCTSRHSRELLLVYEFVPNGTVADHLHGERAKSGLLTWSIRMGIAIESADALSYLHASDTIHRDVKTNNILLDNNFHVKVADFGLSRLFPTDATHVSTAPQGTPGYVDPEYYQCYQLNDKSDVYSFGVVLIELISAKPAVDITRHRHEINLSNMAINKIHNDALHELVDPSLGFESNYNTKRMITMVAELAFRCLQQEKDMRPSMNEVLEALKEIENEQYKAEKEKAEEADLPADARLLKNIQPLSPNSVADKWVSNSTTPNTSA